MAQIWFDGAIVPQEEIQVSILAHTLHYGVGVFEGIRSYACDDGTAGIFRLDDHLVIAGSWLVTIVTAHTLAIVLQTKATDEQQQFLWLPVIRSSELPK